MKKKLLLSLGAAAIAMSASAVTYNLGEAFAYKIDPTFAFEFLGDGPEAQYPAMDLQGQASLEYGFGMANAWFSQHAFGNAETANQECPVVEDPWNAGSHAILMQAPAWWAFGNFNFALPEVGEPCRIRVIYRVNETVTANSWYTEGDGKKPFAVKLMNDADQDTPDYPEVTEDNALFWTNPGWRVAEFVSNLDSDVYYISLLWNAAGLSCGRNVPFYVKEVSVVPLSKLNGYTAPADNKSLTVVQDLPDLVYVNENGGTTGDDGAYKLGEAFCYDVDPTFAFEFLGDGPEAQYPAMDLQGQASLEYGFGLANAWFSQHAFGSAEVANTECPVVADPWNADSYAIRMQAPAWWAFGNFNFALPEVGKPSRIRVIYRVDETVTANGWYTEGDGKKPFAVKLMNDADQDTPDYPELTEDNALFWTNPGWRVADFISNLDSDVYYISLLWNAAGLSCGRNVPFYVKEVSVVPLDRLVDYNAPEGDKLLTVVQELPALVKVDRNGGAGVEGIEGDVNTVAINGLTGAVSVAGFEGTVEVYNLVGQLVAKANVNGAAEVAAPAGVAIVKAGNTVAKVIVR